MTCVDQVMAEYDKDGSGNLNKGELDKFVMATLQELGTPPEDINKGDLEQFKS